MATEFLDFTALWWALRAMKTTAADTGRARDPMWGPGSRASSIDARGAGKRLVPELLGELEVERLGSGELLVANH